MTKDAGITAVAVGTSAPGAKADRAFVVDCRAVMRSRAMTNCTISAAGMTAGAVDQAEVAGTVTEAAIIFMKTDNNVYSTSGIMANGASRGCDHIAACLMVFLDVEGMVVWSIKRMMALNTIYAVTLFAPENFLLVCAIVGIMTACTNDSADSSGDPTHMFGSAIDIVTIDTGQGRSEVKFDLIVLGSMWGNRIHRAMTELAITRACAGTAFQYSGGGSVARIALIFMDIGDHSNFKMTACGAGCGLGQCCVRWRQMVAIIRASGLMAVNTIARAASSVAIGLAQ